MNENKEENNSKYTHTVKFSNREGVFGKKMVVAGYQRNSIAKKELINSLLSEKEFALKELHNDKSEGNDVKKGYKELKMVFGTVYLKEVTKGFDEGKVRIVDGAHRVLFFTLEALYYYLTTTNEQLRKVLENYIFIGNSEEFRMEYFDSIYNKELQLLVENVKDVVRENKGKEIADRKYKCSIDEKTEVGKAFIAIGKGIEEQIKEEGSSLKKEISTTSLATETCTIYKTSKKGKIRKETINIEARSEKDILALILLNKTNFMPSFLEPYQNETRIFANLNNNYNRISVIEATKCRILGYFEINGYDEDEINTQTILFNKLVRELKSVNVSPEKVFFEATKYVLAKKDIISIKIDKDNKKEKDKIKVSSFLTTYNDKKIDKMFDDADFTKHLLEILFVFGKFTEISLMLSSYKNCTNSDILKNPANEYTQSIAKLNNLIFSNLDNMQERQLPFSLSLILRLLESQDSKYNHDKEIDKSFTIESASDKKTLINYSMYYIKRLIPKLFEKTDSPEKESSGLNMFDKVSIVIAKASKISDLNDIFKSEIFENKAWLSESKYIENIDLYEDTLLTNGKKKLISFFIALTSELKDLELEELSETNDIEKINYLPGKLDNINTCSQTFEHIIPKNKNNVLLSYKKDEEKAFVNEALNKYYETLPFVTVLSTDNNSSLGNSNINIKLEKFNASTNKMFKDSDIKSELDYTEEKVSVLEQKLKEILIKNCIFK